jgi:outer membrane protein assembly factor BamB
MRRTTAGSRCGRGAAKARSRRRLVPGVECAESRLLMSAGAARPQPPVIAMAAVKSAGSAEARSHTPRSTSPPAPSVVAQSSDQTTMTARQRLNRGWSILSPNGQYKLILTYGGNLVELALYGKAIFSTNTNLGRSRGDHAIVQADGNFVVYDQSGHPLWSTGTHGNPYAFLALNNAGALQILQADTGKVLWTASHNVTMSDGVTTVTSPLTLNKEKSIQSPNGEYRLTFQNNGNLVEYGPGGVVVFASNTADVSWVMRDATFESDGNFVIYNHWGHPVWSTGTKGNPGAVLTLNDSGTLQILQAGTGKVLWTQSWHVTMSGGVTTATSPHKLSKGQWIQSPNGKYKLTMQADGNLAVTGPGGETIFTSDTAKRGQYATLQADGNLVVYGERGGAVWSTGTHGNPGAVLTLNDSGTLHISQPGTDTALWRAGTPVVTMSGGVTTATSPLTLYNGQSIKSPNGKYKLTMQADGNLAEHGPDGNVIFASNTASWSSRRRFASFQADGNLVVYDESGGAVWSTGTQGNPGAVLTLNDSGTLQILQAGTGVALWTEGTPIVTQDGGITYATSPLRFDRWGGGGIWSPNRQYSLRMLPDGLAELGPNNKILFDTYTTTRWRGGQYAIFQSDGNLVVYDGRGIALWSTGTHGNPGARLWVSDSGDLVIVRGATTLWRGYPKT